MSLKVYGLKNCDTCRKALKWLAAENIVHDFIDVRADGVETATLKRWIEVLGPQQLVNKSSTSWRQLEDSQKADLSPDAVLALVSDHITLVKRPVIEGGGHLSVGFKPDVQNALKAL
ncbi:MAG: Spx/MgsR family RNA polymerase-binding regulatory protein [Parvibaculales bacterium]